jgi:hypothetical protein
MFAFYRELEGTAHLTLHAFSASACCACRR